MRNFRAVAGSAIVSGCLVAGNLCTGSAAAQTAEPVGPPLQLLQLTHPGKSQGSPRTKLAAKTSTKPATKHEAKHEAKTLTAEKRTTRSHAAVAERKPHHLQSVARASEPPTTESTSATAANNSPPPAPTTTTVDATTLAPATQPEPVPQAAAVPQAVVAPQVVAPVAPSTPSQLIVNGQTVQVASADEANEMDLAANDAAAANDATFGSKPASNTVTGQAAELPAKAYVASEATTEAPKGASSTSWLLQVLAALGGAVAAGAVAWFLIGSTPQRTPG